MNIVEQLINSSTQLLSGFLKDPILFWTALGAIAQTIAALVVIVSIRSVIPQLKQFRVEGLRVALELLDKNKQFDQVAEEALNNRTIHGVDWDNLVEQISLIALLVDEKFTNEKLLFIHKGKQLSAISYFLKTDQVSADVRQKLREEYPKAFNLLDRAQRWQEKQRQVRES
jgi:hypothetical protein